jgi:hypothetical protein
MAENATLHQSIQEKAASCDPICLICRAAEVCSTAKAEILEKKNVHLCNSAFFAERGCLS